MEQLKTHTLISVVLIALGGLLMARQMYVDSEPGAIPLLLIVFGVAWYVLTRVRASRHK
jgi:hypothetical protein